MIDLNLPVPTHVGVIMDGNRRWARQHNVSTLEGHKQGVQTLKNVIEAAAEIGVSVLTVYSFSTENWGRSEDEVFGLKSLFAHHLNQDVKALHEKGVRIKFIGDISPFGKSICKAVCAAEELTAQNTQITLCIALNYGGRQDIVQACQAIAKAAVDGTLKPAAITEQHIAQHLYTAALPDPDVIIRTSGEQRLSNFLIWQAAYAEYIFTDIYWPDFSGEQFKLAIEAYQKRERRYGKSGVLV